MYQRLVKQYGISNAENQAKIAMELLNNNFGESDYISFLEKNGEEFT